MIIQLSLNPVQQQTVARLWAATGKIVTQEQFIESALYEVLDDLVEPEDVGEAAMAELESIDRKIAAKKTPAKRKPAKKKRK